MTDSNGSAPTTPCSDDDAAALAAAAGVAELAAAVAFDTDEANGLRAACVRHEIALGHRLAMAFAAAGNAALDVSLAAAAATDVAAAPGVSAQGSTRAADLSAARLGGAAARVMGNVRLALLSLVRLPVPEEEHWVGVSFTDNDLCSPEEAARRLAVAKAARAAAQGLPVPGENETRTRALTAADRARFAAARAATDDLAANAGVAALAGAAGEWGYIKGLLCHELAAAHRLVMRLGGRAADLLTRASGADDRTEALRLAAAAARLMARGRQGLATLPQVGPGPDGGPRRVAGYYWVGKKDMFARGEERGQSPLQAGPMTEAEAEKGTVPFLRVPLLRRGRLNNGNPSGDYMVAPRCGARTRTGTCCRQPAMANGRCRFHGGKSTGPRTAAGLARSRAARRSHGGYSAEIIDLRHAAAAHARRVKSLLASAGGRASGARRQSVTTLALDSLHPAAVSRWTWGSSALFARDHVIRRPWPAASAPPRASAGARAAATSGNSPAPSARRASR